VNVPPYIDPTERGSYDTDELDALEAAAAEVPAAEVVTDDTA
jgi:hypothetical protein